MSGLKTPGTEKVVALLNRYECPTPLHAVRTRFLGSIVSPVPDRSPLQTIQELWGGKMPAFDAIDELNNLLGILVENLWNPLTAHQNAGNPFKLMRMRVTHTRKAVRNYAVVRKQEAEGFMDGLFGPYEEIDIPESARGGAEALEEIRGMLAGTVDMLDNSAIPAPSDELKGLAGSLQALARILEKEMNNMVLACTHARKEALAERRRSGPTVH